MRRLLILGVVLLLVGAFVATGPEAAAARSGITASNDRAEIYFPEKVTFQVDLESEAEIDEIVLEYGVEQQTCGTVVAKAFPEFTPSQNVSASWTWEMKQSGSQPPGAQIWWRWYAADADGNELLTETQWITWIDEVHKWLVIEGDSINLHWYAGSQAFAEELHADVVDALVTIDENMGLKPDGPIDIYVYASFDDLRDAVFYEPEWVGGQAYTDYNSVIVGIPPDDDDSADWGRDVCVHELTHVLVHRFTFSCLFSLPTWLDEGLSEFVERGDEGLGDDRADFEAAVADDTLLSVRALGGSFPEDAVHESYVQSYTLVDFLIAEYGREKIVALLAALRDGVSIDDALQEAYGFDQDGLEDAWREHIGAQPRIAGGAEPTPTPVPTAVPTLEPIAGVPLATVMPARPTSTPAPPAAATRTPMPTSTPDDALSATPSEDGGGISGLVTKSGVIIIASVVCVTGLVVLVLAFVIVRRRRNA